MNDDKCGNCKFFLQEKLTKQGACRRFPPTVFLIHQPQGFTTSTCYPGLMVEGWCGEHSRKVELNS